VLSLAAIAAARSSGKRSRRLHQLCRAVAEGDGDGENEGDDEEACAGLAPSGPEQQPRCDPFVR
jgi:hypothetical protein